MQYILILILFFPSIALSDVGLTDNVDFIPYMLYAFIPIIAIEASMIGRCLHLSTKKSYAAVLIANLVSTCLGMLITLVLLLIVQIFSEVKVDHNLTDDWLQILSTIVQLPWVFDGESEPKLAIAVLLLLVPFFYASWKIETWIVYKMNKFLDYYDVSRACLHANLVTFLLLAIFPVIEFSTELARGTG